MAHYVLGIVSLEFCVTIYHMYSLVFVYNFYVYLITGKQFRSELHKLFCRCPFSRSSSCTTTTTTHDNVRVARRGQADTAV